MLKNGKAVSKPRKYDHYKRCEQILLDIVRRCNDRRKNRLDSSIAVGFAPDWGGNSLTVFMDDSHTHVGGVGKSDDVSFEDLIERLHARMIDGEGLSLAIFPPKPDESAEPTEPPLDIKKAIERAREVVKNLKTRPRYPRC